MGMGYFNMLISLVQILDFFTWRFCHLAQRGRRPLVDPLRLSSVVKIQVQFAAKDRRDICDQPDLAIRDGC